MNSPYDPAHVSGGECMVTDRSGRSAGVAAKRALKALVTVPSRAINNRAGLTLSLVFNPKMPGYNERYEGDCKNEPEYPINPLIKSVPICYLRVLNFVAFIGLFS